jgi:hypothetical protein
MPKRTFEQHMDQDIKKDNNKTTSLQGKYIGMCASIIEKRMKNLVDNLAAIGKNTESCGVCRKHNYQIKITRLKCSHNLCAECILENQSNFDGEVCVYYINCIRYIPYKIPSNTTHGPIFVSANSFPSFNFKAPTINSNTQAISPLFTAFNFGLATNESKAYGSKINNPPAFNFRIPETSNSPEDQDTTKYVEIEPDYMDNISPVKPDANSK